MAKISEVEDHVLQRMQRLVDEGSVNFRDLQCPRCGEIGGLEVSTGDTVEVTFICHHSIYGDLAESYLTKAFPGANRG